jgi:flagellar biosynthesis component FlhA
MNNITGFSKMIMLISFLFIFIGLFTPLPFYIFSTAGVVGSTIGWLMYLKVSKSDNDEEYIDVEFKEASLKPISFDEKLRKIEELRMEHLITEEEYNIKRKQILKEKW